MRLHAWLVGSIVTIMGFGLGCSQSDQQEVTAIKNTPISQSELKHLSIDQSPDFTKSSIDSDFPVPKQATQTDHRSKNPSMKYVRYQYPGLTDPKLREPYFTEIEKWGWNELKEEQMGSMHIFKRGEKRLHVTIHQDFFTLFIQPG